jgi:PAS domain S-box-containing protein
MSRSSARNCRSRPGAKRSPRPDSVFIATAPSAEITFSNRYADRVVGRRLSDLADDFPMFHLDGRPYTVTERPAPRAIATGEAIIDEEFLGPAVCSGRVRYRCSCWPVYDESGEVVAVVGATRDVTEQAPQEERLRYLAGLLDTAEDAIVALDAQWFVTVWSRGAERMYGWTAEEVLGRHTLEVAELELTYEERGEVRRAVVEEGRWRGEMMAYRKDGTRLWVELIMVALRDERGEVTGYLGIHRDVTERRQAEDARREAQDELGRRAEQQALVAGLGRRALAADDLQPLLDEAVGLVARTLDVELACVAEVPAAGEVAILRAGVGWREGFVGRRFERGRNSQAGYTLLRGEPVIAEDQAADPRFERSPVAEQHDVVSALTVTIAGAAEPFGVLEALSTRRRAFSPSEVSFVQAVANVLGGAVERSRSSERLAGVREADRRRIARDLHDGALQELTHALALGSRRADAEGADELVAALTRARARVRAAEYDLRLGDEQQAPFPELLHSLVDVHRAIAGDSRIELDAGPGVPAEPLGATGSETLRIVGEALTNARRHSEAGSIRVRVWGSPGRLHADVSDDGRGFDPASAAGHGVAGMRERARLLDADLEIRSGPAIGTTVRLDVPVERARRTAAEQVRVLFVDDHTAVRQAIAAMFEREPGFTVAGQARSLAEARGLLRDVDVAVLDLALPDGDGADLIPELHEASPDAQALVLSADLDRDGIARAVEAGAAGALDKTAELDQLVDAVRRLRAGQTLLSRDEIAALVRFAGGRRERERADRDAIALLTAREREVLEALGAGLDAESIADRLGISIRTERNHVARILTKLGVHTQLQAVLFAMRYGLIEDRRGRRADGDRDRRAEAAPRDASVRMPRAPLDARRERALVRAAQREAGPARARLVEYHLPFIESIARAVRSTSRSEHAALVDEGVGGLLRALERYDPELSTPFWAYAGWWVRDAMRQRAG